MNMPISFWVTTTIVSFIMWQRAAAQRDSLKSKIDMREMFDKDAEEVRQTQIAEHYFYTHQAPK